MNSKLRGRMMEVMDGMLEQMDTVHVRDFGCIERSRERIERQRTALARIIETRAALSASTAQMTMN